MGCRPIVLVKVSVKKKIKGIAHENGDVDGTFKESLRKINKTGSYLGCFVVVEILPLHHEPAFRPLVREDAACVFLLPQPALTVSVSQILTRYPSMCSCRKKSMVAMKIISQDMRTCVQKETCQKAVTGACCGVFTLPYSEADKSGLYRFVWMCSHCTESDTNIDSKWVLCWFVGICVCLGLCICLGVG